MDLIWAAIIGLVAGAIAKLLMPGKDPGGIFMTMLLGIAGALGATLIGRAVGWYDEPGESAGLIGAVVGAVIILIIYRLLRGGGGSAVPT